jgi:hypothetical protein
VVALRNRRQEAQLEPVALCHCNSHQRYGLHTQTQQQSLAAERRPTAAAYVVQVCWVVEKMMKIRLELDQDGLIFREVEANSAVSSVRTLSGQRSVLVHVYVLIALR